MPPRPRTAGRAALARWAAAAVLLLAAGAARAQLDVALRESVLALSGDDTELDRKASASLLPRPFELGYEVTANGRRNLDLDATEPDRRNRLSQELTLGAYHRIDPRWSMRLRIKGLSERDWLRDGGKRTDESAGARDEMWLRRERAFGLPLTVQVGRVPLSEARTWWWDSTLDAVRATWRGQDSFVDAGLGREVVRVSTLDKGVDPAERGVWRLFARAGHVWEPRHSVEAFLLHANDRSPAAAVGGVVEDGLEDTSDARLTWLGLRLQGESRDEDGSRLRYWADFAALRGSDTRFDTDDGPSDGQLQYSGRSTWRVSASAFDVGLTASAGTALLPSLTLAWARGSGDQNPDAGRDTTFRQTGLHENKTRFRGVTRFRAYGEVLRPDLSNLDVTTIGWGIRPTEATSIDLIWHGYRQVRASRTLASSRIDRSPQGLSRELGSEIDLVLGWRVNTAIDAAVRFGTFKAGKAFGNHALERARNLEAGLEVAF